MNQSAPDPKDLFIKDLFLMYDKENLKILYKESLELKESMENPNYYRARIVRQYEYLKEKGVYPVTHLAKLDSS